MSRSHSVVLSALLALAPAAAVAQQSDGCDVPTTSYAGVVAPSRHAKPGPIVVQPQTPCPTIPNGYEGMIGQLSVDINTFDPSANQQNQDGTNPGQPPTQRPPKSWPKPPPNRWPDPRWNGNWPR